MSGQTPEEREKLLHEIEGLASRGLTKEQISAALGICRTTLHNWERGDEQIGLAIKRGKAKGIGTISNVLFDKAKAGQSWAVCFYLKTVGGYRETVVNQVVGSDNGPVQVASMSNDEFRQIAESVVDKV